MEFGSQFDAYFLNHVAKVGDRMMDNFFKSDDIEFALGIFTDASNIKVRGNNEYEIYKNLMKNVDSDKVELVLNDIFALPSKKSNLLSNNLRNEGNVYYTSKQFSLCLDLYGKSLQFAEYNTVSYALTLANRSAVFFHLKNYKDSLKDIHLCLLSNYPEGMKPKLFVRKIQCYQKLGLQNGMLAAISDLTTFLNNSSTLQSSEKEKYQTLANKLADGRNVIDIKAINELKLPPIPTYTQNSKFPQAASNVFLKYLDSNESRVIAAANIKKGEVLFVEKSAAILPTNPEGFFCYLLCCYCSTRIIQWIPCRECTTRIYCDDECRNNDFVEYHKWECLGKRVNFWKRLPEENMAFRILLQTINTESSTDLNVENIDVCMEKLKKMTGTLLKYFASSVLIVRYLEKYTDIFNHIRNTKKAFSNLKHSDIRLRIGSLILKYCAVTLFKVAKIDYHIIQLDKNGRTIDFFENRKYAYGFYPTSCNINHACAPNASYYFTKDTIVIKANQDIKTNEEIFCSWYSNCHEMKDEDRSIFLLSKYNLKCTCRTCSGPYGMKLNCVYCTLCKGPSEISILNYESTVYTKFKCLRCSHEFNIHELFRHQLNYLKTYKDKTVEVLNRVKVLQNVLAGPNREISQYFLYLCGLYLLTGNVKLFLKIFKQYTDMMRDSMGMRHYFAILLNCVNDVLLQIEGCHLYVQIRPVLQELRQYLDEIKMCADFIYPENEEVIKLQESFEKIVNIFNMI